MYRLGKFPALWWDEGWTLSAARNWVEHGHLGHYLAGKAVLPRSPVRFPVVVPVALSMKILGVGTWQGRLPGVIFTVLALSLVLYLTGQIFSRKVGIAALFVLLCLSPYSFHPFVMGRQVLAEMPMLFYLLAGYSLTWLALTRSAGWGVGAVLVFGVAIHAKLQVLPFWLVSFGMAGVMALLRNWRQQALILARVAAGSAVAAVVLLGVQNMFMPGALDEPALQKILFNTVVVVLNWPVRWQALKIALIYALPELLGYAIFGWRILQQLRVGRKTKAEAGSMEEANRDILQIAIWGLGASWFGWYVTMSMFWDRYLFPAYFIGAIFFAVYLGEYSAGFDLRLIVRRASGLLLGRGFNRLNVQALAGFPVFCVILAIAIVSFRQQTLVKQPDPYQAAAWLSDHVQAGALVETFESELFFLAPNLNYHFPSDLVSMQLARKWNVDPLVVIDYDPLEAKPDYLVVGPYSQTWQLYDTVLAQSKWKLEADIGGYQIYHFQAILP